MSVKSNSVSAVVLIVAVLIAVVGVATLAVAGSRENAISPIVIGESHEAVTTEPSTVALARADADGVLFMREEEKLARDVYLRLGEMWDLRIFENIAAAEQRHMDAVLELMETHGLEDPETSAMVGVFANDDLQTLYDGLMTLGSESAEAALDVGATVEEVDIADLTEYLATTTAPEIATVYENLLQGSRNHLRAFVSQLDADGIEREATVLDPGLYASIVSTESARGNGRSSEQDGEAWGSNGRQRQGGGQGNGIGHGRGVGTAWGGRG